MVSSRCQVVIFGAGIAGLWTLRRLREAGYHAVLLETGAIGCGQTLASQGILHGGVKYGLDGAKREIATLLSGLPPVWLECLAGKRTPDLRSARVLSSRQHLWAADSWLARAGATVGARALRGEVRKLEREAWPEALREGGHRGAVYELEETVVEVRSVLRALAAPVAEFIYEVPGERIYEKAEHGGLRSVRCGSVTIEADAFLFTAATGNEDAAEWLGLGRGVTQRRPLKQIMARGELPPLYGHCVTVSPKPVATITTHPLTDTENVWYLGGGVAEDGVNLSDGEAIRNAREKLAGIFPKRDFSRLRWACWSVDRAEPNAASRLPDGPALLERGNAALAWPAKLVYAPALAEKALEFVKARVSPAADGPRLPLPLPPAMLGHYPWETADWRDIP